MKKSYFTFIIVFIFSSVLFLTEMNAQGFKGLDQVPHDISYYRASRVTTPLVKVLYGRPSNEGQKVFGNIIPFGEVWRTGHNEATEIKFFKDVLIGDTKVAAGTYVLLTIPGKDKWEIIISSQTDVWGAFQYNPMFDVARITVPVSKAETLQIFSIDFKEKDEAIQMVLGWDQTRVKIPLHFKKETRLVKR